LFGELPLVEFTPAEQKERGVRPPVRKPLKQEIIGAQNRPEPVAGVWTVASANPRADADRLLADFLPRAFRRPVAPDVRAAYVAKVEARLQAGDCFESAMRWAYRAALCAPDFLYHVESSGKLDAHALANRLAYFLWNSRPDDALLARAADCGFEALVLTSDANVPSGREWDQRSYRAPGKLTFRSWLDALLHPHWGMQILANGMPQIANVVNFIPPEQRSTARRTLFIASQVQRDIHWEDIRQLRDQWKGKLLVKGILTPDDARRALELGGYRVAVAHSGTEALDLMGASPEPVDLLLTDVVMPGQGGFALSRAITALRHDTRTIFMSGHPPGAQAREEVDASGWRCLQKPFSLATLSHELRATLDADRAA